ncbi:Oxidoreductase FAD-binding domain-containing protein [Chitinophaga sp. YR573]|uniref:siderophore-interacting protein n=1 Tax=Chitinophaga sp. YR573 TaxID=1881040 RepID=UPI0008ABBD77|nr:siderophore-interacting protein [Chitinophaga sp. YR573]SEW18580.1 Oxidoreductase FAD-binding domain-containing protein [Chitinophaga sp. YR573]
MSTFKEKATAFLMSRIGKTAYVINTTAITDSLLQITLHLPEAINWRSCQHLKCEVGKQAYRDYTIASWDQATQTAVLLIHTSHEGTGSNWAKQLQPEQSFFYAGPGGGFHQPTAADNLVCIGDASAIGHFVSLYKCRHPQQQFHAMIIDKHLPSTILDMPIHTGTSEQLTNWVRHLPVQETTFYLAGNIPLLVKTRKTIKDLGGKQIKSAGFWE